MPRQSGCGLLEGLLVQVAVGLAVGLHILRTLSVGAGSCVPGPGASILATAYGNRFFVPLGFELLRVLHAIFQSALGDRL
jgi:hypothetical protein